MSKWNEFFNSKEQELIKSKHMLCYKDMQKEYVDKDEVVTDIKCNYGYWLAVDITGSDTTLRFDTIYKYIFNCKWSEIMRIAEMEKHAIYPYMKGV